MDSVFARSRQWSLNLLIATLCAAMIGPSTGFGASSTAEEILAGANERIERHRQADGAVRVLDREGKPVSGVSIRIEQTRHAFLFGCNIFQWGKLAQPNLEEAYRNRFAELMNYATLPFYWASYERVKGRPRHEETQRVARWCREQGIVTKGHPLAWNYSDPPWLPDDLDEIYRLQLARIEDCISRFAGQIDRWDVVNEATHFDRPEFLNERAPKHSAAWKKVGRLEFARACFEAARETAPDAELLINDYRTDPAYERVVEGLVDSDGRRLYDAVGIQSHMHRGVWATEKLWDVCERFARFGVPLHFTELTILSGEKDWQRRGAWPSTPEGEAWQAQEAVRIYTVLFSHPAVEAITWWDFCDFYAWQRAPAGFLRRDMTPKPVYHALRRLIKETWWTDLTVTTDGDGRAAFRGFPGDYRVSMTNQPEGADQAFVLAKAGGEPWEIRDPSSR